MIIKKIDWDIVDNMLIAGCNGVQCAAAIGVHPETLYYRCQDEKQTVFTVYAQEKRAHGDGLLHAAQFQKAYKDKNPTMLIWLGKQRLSQKEDKDNQDIKDLEGKFDKSMDQVLELLGSSERNIDENSINIETKS